MSKRSASALKSRTRLGARKPGEIDTLGGTRLGRGETARLLLGGPRGQFAYAPRGAKAW